MSQYSSQFSLDSHLPDPRPQADEELLCSARVLELAPLLSPVLPLSLPDNEVATSQARRVPGRPFPTRPLRLSHR